MNGYDSVKCLLVGPAVSKRYGDISSETSRISLSHRFPALQESDDLGSVATSALLGGMELARFWQENRPDAALVIADRTETLGVSVTASLMQIPLIHLQGGEISGSIDDKVRNANSKLADFHLTTNTESKKNLLRLGESEELIRIVGCPSIDLVVSTLEKKKLMLNSNEYGGVGSEFNLAEKFGIIMFHPDTLAEENLDWINFLIGMINDKRFKNYNWFWFWPNPDHGTTLLSQRIRRAREANQSERVRFIINLDPELFVSLASEASFIVGNSSFGIRESSYLGLPSVNLGSRQSNRQRGCNVLDIYNYEDSILSFEKILRHIERGRFQREFIYGKGDSGKRSAEEITAWLPRLKGNN
jgi:UDP-hydrolysing UDP-N-acetyl-D-glucosamine 2-epimerase